MKWVKRGLWTAAWGVWAWCGFGLARELPRELGRRICQLPMKENEGCIGFLEGKHEFVTYVSQGKFKPHLIRVWNAETGALIKQINGPLDTGGFYDLSFRRKHGLVIGDRRPGEEGRASSDAPAASVLDLNNSRWIDLPTGCDRSRGFHPTKPWAWFQDEEKRPNSDETSSVVKVIDLRTGAVLFSWSEFGPRHDPVRLYSKPVFVEESFIALPVRKSTDVGEVVEERLEVWSIPASNKPTNVFRNVTVGDDPMCSETSRIAWHLDSNDPWIDVFDIHEGRFVFTFPPNRTRWEGAVSGHDYGVILSHDGKTLYRHHADKLFEVDTGTVLWELHELQRLGPLEKRESLKSVYWKGPFEVLEEWYLNSETDPQVQTYAVRDFASGKLLFRYNDTSVEIREMSTDLQLLFRGHDNAVYGLPLRVNCALLALCQTILALPLILLWTILRWHRKRRLRLASVQP